MSNPEPKVSGVVVNFQTPDLTRRAIESLRQFYPRLPLLLIDNGSKDNSREVLQELQTTPATTLLFNKRNLFHGPAMHQAMAQASSTHVFFLDSDCIMFRGGALERMLEIADQDDLCYAVGKRVTMNKRGFDVPEQSGAIPYIRPICMLVKREIYGVLPPFRHHGTPCLDNMRDAVSRGYHLLDFPVLDYVTHEGRGTAGLYGYGLGLSGKLNHLLNKMGL